MEHIKWAVMNMSDKDRAKLDQLYENVLQEFQAYDFLASHNPTPAKKRYLRYLNWVIIKELIRLPLRSAKKFFWKIIP